MIRKTEILAPAGSYESLKAAVNAGADAVYLGGSLFGARASAASVGEGAESIIEGIAYAHHFGVKVYLTVNVLVKEREMKELYPYLLPFYKAGADAFIVQDLGVLKHLHALFPDIEKHASTQMSIMGQEAVDILRKYGVSRIVPARELSLKEIGEIYKNTGIEIESFVHGALCYAYSGQCLMSSLIGGRSGNRGRCAQTCRLEYDLYDEKRRKLNRTGERHLLSCKDLCALDILPSLIEAGVYSLKIEGRMKSPIYTAGVVSIWRKYVDLYEKEGKASYRVAPEDKRLLLDLFDRGGHTEGYYRQHNGRDLIALEGKPKQRIVNEAFQHDLEESYLRTVRRLPVSVRVDVTAGQEMRMQVRPSEARDNGLQYSASWGIPEPAAKRGVSREDIAKQIGKTGNTLYEMAKLDIHLEEGLFVPVKMLNELRRRALEGFGKALIGQYERREPTLPVQSPSPLISSSGKKGERVLHLVCEEAGQLAALLTLCGERKAEIRERGYTVELAYGADAVKAEEWKSVNEKIRAAGWRSNLYMPHIFRTHARRFFAKNKEKLKNADFDGFLIRNLEELGYLETLFAGEEKRGAYIFDYTLYGMNKEAAGVFRELGAERQTLPVELNLAELSPLSAADKEILIYGRLAMMVSASCLRKNTLGCDGKPSVLYLKDRMQKDMPVKNHCEFCYNTILNSQPLSGLGIHSSISGLQAGGLRLNFTIEDERECRAVLNSYIDCLINGKDSAEKEGNFTRGHFKRGID